MLSNKKAKPFLDQIIRAGGENLSGPKEGEIIEAELIDKTSREAHFDIGPFSTGIVYGKEFAGAKSILRNLAPGDRIPARIIKTDNENGYIELSIAEADKQKLWQEVKDLQESGEIVSVKVLGANSGGLTVNLLNLKAFLPISQLANDHQPKIAENNRSKILDELRKFTGEELNVKIIDINPKNNKLIVSERESASANVKELLEKYQVGQEIDGLVSGIADFGVFVKFVDNPNIEGMIHISELDHKIIDNPKEAVKINDAVRVKIIDIKDNRVFLSLKALKPDPWERVLEKYKTGQEIAGKVYKFNPFGAVIDLGGEIQGMIHISKFGGEEEMKKALTLEKEHKFVIESINPADKRLILNLKK